MSSIGDSSINPAIRRKRKPQRPPAEWVRAIMSGDRLALSEAITLVESTRPSDEEAALAVLEGCLPAAGRSFRLGITGVPGVGKSTFIDAFGQWQLEQGRKLAVLAVDPSSTISRGSIMGDKTRMATLGQHPNVFIRPSPAGNTLGGVAAKTREIILLCEAAGYHYIVVETVGVGQSEVAVSFLTDFFLLLLLPAGGDELQGIKRGVVEMADLIAINKADGDRVQSAKQAQAAYQRALHLFPPKASQWEARALTCSAQERQGIPAIAALIETYRTQSMANGYLAQRRAAQQLHWLQERLGQGLQKLLLSAPESQAMLQAIEDEVARGITTPFAGAHRLLKQLERRIKAE